MPPSPGGSRSGTSTRRPAARSSAGVALEQPPVVEHAARQDHDADPRAGGAAHASAVARGDGVVEAGGDDAGRRRRRAGRRAIASDHRPRRRARARPAAARRRRARRVGGGLELDRGLALVGDLGADPAERGDRVEQPAHARRRPARRAACAPARRRRASALGVDRRAERAPARAPSAARSHAHAIRHGSRTAGSPPGIRTGRRWPARSKPRRSPRSSSPPQTRAVGAVAGAVVDRARPRGPARRARPGTRRGARGGAGRRRARTPSRSSAYLVERYSGCRSWATISGATANSRSKCATPSANAAQRLGVAQVADVVRDPRARARARQNVLLSSAPHARIGGAASGSAIPAGTYPRERRSDQRPRPDHPHHRVVGARVDRPVVQQQQVGDPGQALERVLVLEGDRLVGDVAAGHHERHARVGEQQVVQRRVREHHPELAGARRDRLRDGRAGRRGASTIGRVARAQQPLLLGAQLHQRRRRGDVGHHQRERLVLAVLARPQRRHRALVGRPHARWNPPSPLIATTPPPRSSRDHRQRRLTLSSGRDSVSARPAVRAGDRLGVEAAVARGPSTPPGRPRTCGSRPSSCSAGRRGRRARS